MAIVIDAEGHNKCNIYNKTYNPTILDISKEFAKRRSCKTPRDVCNYAIMQNLQQRLEEKQYQSSETKHKKLGRYIETSYLVNKELKGNKRTFPSESVR